MNFAIVSKYRTELMGIATLWVLLFHYGKIGIPIIDSLSTLGYGGVDIFLFLSGIGLSFSIKDGVKSFYIKRILRIFPTYFILIIIDSLLSSHINISDIFIKTSCIGYYLFWENINYFEWYVPTILIFYAFFPIWHRLYRNNKLYGYSVILLSLFLTGILAYIGKWSMIYLTITRIPIFFIGGIVGSELNNSNKNVENTKYNILMPAISTLTLLFTYIMVNKFSWNTLWITGLLWIPFIIITPGLCILLSYIFNKVGKTICKIFKFIGNLSFEVYLVHIIVLNHYRDMFNNNLLGKQISFILFCFLIILISYILKSIYKPVHNRLLSVLRIKQIK